jgi:hypothetical protein
MAGAAAKKTARNAGIKTKYYTGIVVTASFVHLLFRIGFHQQTDLWSLIQSGFLVLIGWLSFRMIRSALELGVGFDLWQDLFIINTVVQIGCLWSAYFWIMYLAVPGYAIYQLGGRVLEWVFTPKQEEQETKKPTRRGRDYDSSRRSI